jgi:hypothetical protein
MTAADDLYNGLKALQPQVNALLAAYQAQFPPVPVPGGPAPDPTLLLVPLTLANIVGAAQTVANASHTTAAPAAAASSGMSPVASGALGFVGGAVVGAVVASALKGHGDHGAPALRRGGG